MPLCVYLLCFRWEGRWRDRTNAIVIILLYFEKLNSVALISFNNARETSIEYKLNYVGINLFMLNHDCRVLRTFRGVNAAHVLYIIYHGCQQIICLIFSYCPSFSNSCSGRGGSFSALPRCLFRPCIDNGNS